MPSRPRLAPSLAALVLSLALLLAPAPTAADAEAAGYRAPLR